MEPSLKGPGLRLGHGSGGGGYSRWFLEGWGWYEGTLEGLLMGMGEGG
jgi:hypothetical protein